MTNGINTSLIFLSNAATIAIVSHNLNPPSLLAVVTEISVLLAAAALGIIGRKIEESM